jgi:Mn2+/Fe2+ NRAMP family transporter
MNQEHMDGDSEKTNNEQLTHNQRYPLADSISQERLDAELAELETIEKKPFLRKIVGYMKLGGPGFVGAALTIGAGSTTATMLSGATYGYKTMWVVWFSMICGLFMVATGIRFATKKGRIIPLQNEYHGRVIGSLLTGIGACVLPLFLSAWAQFALSGHLLESLTLHLGFAFPRQRNWVLILGLSVVLTLMYGRKDIPGISIVEKFMKYSILVMVIGFGLSLFKVGINVPEFLRGNLIPWLPPGGEGLDLLIASGSAAIGAGDWVLFHYTGLARGWGPRHEKLGRMDMWFGLFVPFVVINWIIMTVFAQTLYGGGSTIPQTAPELAQAFTPLLGSALGSTFFYVAFLAVPVTSIVVTNIAVAITIFEAFGWEANVTSLRWKICALLPSIGVLGVWMSRPVWLVISVASFMALANNICGWSWYLLLNDKKVMGENRCKNYFWNLGIMVEICFVNAAAISYVLNRLGMFG